MIDRERFYSDRPAFQVMSETLVTTLDSKDKEFSYTAQVIRSSEREPSHPVNGRESRE